MYFKVKNSHSLIGRYLTFAWVCDVMARQYYDQSNSLSGSKKYEQVLSWLSIQEIEIYG